MLSSTKFCLKPAARIPTIVCKSSCPNRDLWDFDISSRVRRLFWPSITVCKTEVKMAGTRFHEEKQQKLTVSRREWTMIGAKGQMQDLSDDKHEKKDAETTQTCKVKRR